VSNPIFDEVAGRRLFVPDSLTSALPLVPPVEPTALLPVVQPATAQRGGTVEYGGHQDHMLPAAAGGEQDDLSHWDHLVVRTFNGLRSEDLAFEQPPQDPGWRPDADS
jgi:hypothetical protein